MSKLLEGLNASQQKAVTHTDGPLLILAGPGSGKTHTVARSIAYAIENRGVGPSRIAAFTFTNKARDDLKERIRDNIVRQDLVNDIWIRTFHSFCGHVSYNHPGKLVTDNDRVFTAKELARVCRAQITRLQYHQFDDKEIFNFIREREKQDISLTKVGNQQVPQVYVDIYKKYRQISENSSDIYTKIQLFTNALLRDVPEVKTEWQEKFELIFVDEFQDTDPIQYQIIKTLAGTRQNLRVVGDDDQGIYGWRGADIQNILNFENDYPTAKLITLGQNYRSTQKIVEASRALVEFNPDRREKDLFTRNFEGEKVIYLHCENADIEANIIADFINRAIREGQNPSHFAVLYRTKKQAHTFEEAFRNREIRYYNLDKKDNLLSKQPKCTVSLMTIHKAKGLEFPNVFVAGVCTGLLPLHNSNEKDWDEELRLLYVAMTRAKNWLCLSSYEEDAKFPRGRSPFLSYIPSSLLKTIETLDDIPIPPKPEEMELPVNKEPSDYVEPLPEKLLGSGMTVIGVDPGNIGALKTNVGWSVTQKTSDGYSVLKHNTEHPTGKKEDKLKWIEDKINSLVESFLPDAIAVEKLEVSIGKVEVAIEEAKADWFYYVASCVAAIRSIADQHGIECRLYTPQDVKYAATNDKNAKGKMAVQKGVMRICNLQQIPEPHHSADAIAASLCYLRSYLNSSRFEGNKRKKERYELGCNCLDQKRYEDAFDKFKEAINIDPIYTDAHCGLGRAYLAQANLEAAENAAKKSLKLAENNHPDSQKLLDAIRHYRLGCNAVNINEAITKFQESIHLEPFFIDAHYELSRAHLRLGNLQEAKDVVEGALKLADDYPPIQRLLDAIKLYNTGRNFLNGRQYNDAIDKFKEAIDKEPTFTEAHYSLGCAYFQSKVLEAAEQSANDTLELNSNHQLVPALLADIKKAYVDKGYDALERLALTEAEEYANKAFNIDKNYQSAFKLFEGIKKAYYEQACDDLNNKQYDQAIAGFNKLKSKDPNFIDAYCGLGRAHFERGELDASKKFANTALQLDRNYSPACTLLDNIKKAYIKKGRDAFNQNDLTEAKCSANEALKLDACYQPTLDLLEDIKQAYYNNGEIYFNREEYTQAIFEFQKAVEIDQNFKRAHRFISEAYLKLGDLEKAEKSARGALDIDQNYKLANKLLEKIKRKHKEDGDNYRNRRYCAAALRSYKHAIRIDNKYKEAYNGRGFVYWGMKEYSKAITAYLQAIRIDDRYRVAHNNLSIVYLDIAEYAKAVNSLKRAIEIKPDCQIAHHNLARTYFKMENLRDASETVLEALRLDANNQQTLKLQKNIQDAYLEQGRNYFRQGNLEAAESSVKAALKLDRNYQPSHEFLDDIKRAYDELDFTFF